MKPKRLYQTLRLWTIPSDSGRAQWAKKHHIYAGIGENVRIMDRKIPLYANLIRYHNNIQVASGVSFITHDAIMSVFNDDKQLVNRGGATSTRKHWLHRDYGQCFYWKWFNHSWKCQNWS